MSNMFRIGDQRLVYSDSGLSASGLWTPPGGGGGGGGELAWPTSATAGVKAGVTRTNQGGVVTLSTNGTVFKDKNVTDTIEVYGSNITIENVMMNVQSYYGLIQYGGSNLTLRNITLNGFGSSSMTGIALAGGTMEYCDISGMVIALKIWDTSVVRYNFIHDLHETSSNPDARHFDGVALHSGTGTFIHHNAFHVTEGTASVFLTTQDGSTTNITVEDNLMVGRPSFAAYSENNNGNTMSGIAYRRNTMQKGIYGYIQESGGGVGSDKGDNVKFDTVIPTNVQAWLTATGISAP